MYHFVIVALVKCSCSVIAVGIEAEILLPEAKDCSVKPAVLFDGPPANKTDRPNNS
jgi:hypothetical protein